MLRLPVLAQSCGRATSCFPPRTSLRAVRQMASEGTRRGRPSRRTAALLAAGAGLGLGWAAKRYFFDDLHQVRPTILAKEMRTASDKEPEEEEEAVHVMNWSGTHECAARHYYAPETLAEVEALVQEEGRRRAAGGSSQLSVVGSALSPNGAALSDSAMLNMRMCDRVLHVDMEKQQVTVEAGISVEQLTEALRPHGLTLQNFASIREQQIGGFTQVGAHGTGARIPPVNEQVVALRMATPALGPLLLGDSASHLFSQDERTYTKMQEALYGSELEHKLHSLGVTNLTADDLFRWCQLSLGAFGVVTAVTLQCVPAHTLVEETTASTAAELEKTHRQTLAENQHVKYLWYPYTDVVLKVTCNPEDSSVAKRQAEVLYKEWSAEEREMSLRNLLKSNLPERFPDGSFEGMTATAVRDTLLLMHPLDPDWVSVVNTAIAEYRVRDEGRRSGASDQLLGFDCGCQQWVLEMALPTDLVVGDLDRVTGERESYRDLTFVKKIMELIEEQRIPAHPPIEQRWTSSSSAALSSAPADAGGDRVYSWVGIILYLPTEDAVEMRAAITAKFREFSDVVMGELGEEFGIRVHWAKLEGAHIQPGSAWKKLLVDDRYDMDTCRRVKSILDPHAAMGSPWTQLLLAEEK